MKDLANRLGISAATVSLALRDSPRISAETRARVRAAAAEMGYVYNRGAAHLRTAQSRIIGVVVPDIRNPAFVKVLRTASRRLNQSGRMLFLCDTRDDIDRQAFFFRALGEYGADGVLVCPARGTLPESLPDAHRGGLPTVCFARRVPDAPVDSVVNDDVEAFRIATRHLLSLGHRRIAVVGGGADISTGRDRRAGFFAAMAEAGAAVDPALLLDSSTDQAGGCRAAEVVAAISPRVTAVLCFGDIIAFGLMLGLRRLGLEPGRDVAVVGCDDVDEAELWHPRLTTVVNKADEAGEQAVELLLQRIEKPDRPYENRVLPTELIIRESCGSLIGMPNDR